MISITDDLIASLPDLVCTELKVRLPDLRRCEPIDGRLNMGELIKRGVADPSVFVSVLDIADGREDGFGAAPALAASMAAFVVTKGSNRSARGIAIAQTIFARVYGSYWGHTVLGPAEAVRAQSITTTTVRDHGTTLWAVTWRQPFVADFTANAEPVDVAIYLPPLDDPDAPPEQVTGAGA